MTKKSNSKKIGNKFQEDFLNSVPSNLYCERYKDSPVRFRAVTNPADYFLNSGDYLLLVECKTTNETTSLPLGNIQGEQVWKMLVCCSKKNTFGGFLLNFRSIEETYFVLVADFLHWHLTRDRESVPLSWIREHGFKLSQRKKISRWTYGIQELLDWIKEVKIQ